MKSVRLVCAATSLCTALSLFLAAGLAHADTPVVTAVPGDANNPTVRHSAISGRPITLKGAVDAASVGASWEWNPGDGSPAYTGTVDATHWAVWAEHTYTGNPGDFFTATLTVDNGVDPVGTATFPIVLRANTVPNQANTAIAEALWYMHRVQTRIDGDVLAVTGQVDSTIPMAYWNYPATGGQVTISVQAATLNAFEANGHRENGDARNPYTETVRRGLRYLFARLQAVSLDVQTVGPLDANPRNDNPDGNGNGLGVTLDGRFINSVTSIDPPYQLGMVMDAVVAAGTPGAVTTTGPANVIGRTYAGIVQDMVDWYAMAQSDNATHGGWQYGAWNNSGGSHDNSASGWAATGIVAAEDLFGSVVPDWLKVRNELGLELTDQESDVSDNDGIHGYTNSPNPIWGQYGTTGAAMVQMSMNGIEATTSPTPDERWVRAENHFRRHFNDAASGNNFKNYYYGMFNFAKAMRTAKPAPVTVIGTVVGVADDATNGIGCGPNPGCAAGGPAPLDWYNDPASGLAATIVSYQATTGANIGLFSDRPGNSHGSNQDDHNQPWATQILTRTLAQAGPIAVGDATPNPAGEGFPITFDHSRSFHQDPNRNLVLFEWDLDNDGTYDESRTELVQDESDPNNLPVTATYDCAAQGGLPCSHIINLRVTDDANPPVTATDVVILDLTIPPHAPTAISGGPYAVCVNEELTVDGSDSFDIDEGQSETGMEPFDTITAYEWELDGVSPFDYGEATGPMAMWTFDTVGIASIGLRVTDNSSQAYPSASMVDLTDTDNTFVTVANCITTDLAVSATADGTSFVVPATVNITGTVTNNGPEDLTDVIVVANLADLVTIVSITPERGSCAATGIKVGTQDQYRCDIGDLASGESVDIDVVADAPDEGSGLFEFTADVDGGPLVQLTDSDPSNNSVAVIVDFIDEIIVIVKGKGKGTGAFGFAGLVLFGAVAGAVALLRRRTRLRGVLPALVVLALCGVVVPGTAQADEHMQDTGFYAGIAVGSAAGDVSASQFSRDLSAAGYDVSDVSLDDSASGWKLTLGYMLNSYLGLQVSYVDLGDLRSELTASVSPDDVDDLLRTAAGLLPGRGEGILADLLLQYPLSERVAVYATLGVFFAEPETEQVVISGGSGSASRADEDNDFAGSIGLSFAATRRLAIKVGYERYDIDGSATDFPAAGLVYRFGGRN